MVQLYLFWWPVLVDVRLRRVVDLGFCKSGTGRRFTSGVTHHCGEITDDQHCEVTFILETSQRPQDDGMTKVQVARRGVETQFDPQRPPGREALRKFGPRNDVGRALQQP